VPAATAAQSPRTVRGAITRVQRAGVIDAETADRYRRIWSSALSLHPRLPAGRRAELGAVIATTADIARRRLLTSSRMPVVFLTVERNTEWWRSRGGPRAPQPPPSNRPCAGGAGLGGARVEFEGDPVVFQWYPGQGLQVQQLATFGKANALGKVCLGEARGTCRAERFRRAVDRITEIASERRGFLAWEYFFRFGGGRAPWLSGLAQGTAMQALSRGSRFFNEPRYLDVARRGLGAFSHGPPIGVRVRTGVGSHYLIYSFNPGLRVLNGFLQSLVGLYDYAEAANDDRARELFRSGDRQARREVPRHDTGSWSLYSAGGNESDAGYHRLVRDFLKSLCDRTRARLYCGTATRFNEYLRRPTRITMSGLGARARRSALVRFRLSKISCVTLRVSRAGSLVTRRSAVLGRGSRALAWVPPRAGRYTVTVEALDLNNNRSAVRREVVARR
jgi:hypothetical protein